MATIAELQIKVDTSDLERAKVALDGVAAAAGKVNTSTAPAAEGLGALGDTSDKTSSAVERLIAQVTKQNAIWGQGKVAGYEYDAALLGITDRTKLYTDSIREQIELSKQDKAAKREQASVMSAIQKSHEGLGTAQYAMIEKLREEIALFGKSKDEILLYRAGLMGISDQVAPLVQKLNELKAAKDAESKSGLDGSAASVKGMQTEGQALKEKNDDLQRVIQSHLELNKLQAVTLSSGANSNVRSQDFTVVTSEAVSRQKELNAEIARTSEEYKSVKYAIDPAYKRLDDLEVLQTRLNNLLSKGGLGKDEYDALTASLNKTRESVKFVGSSVEDTSDDFKKLRAAIDPAAAAMDKLVDQQAKLSSMKGKISTEEYTRLNTMLDASKKRIQDLGASTGKTAKEINFAMRGLPAQFTDIFVSLQGGQAPLTVFLQQGGQLKDMFGGIGPAFKAMGGYILGLINPLSLSIAAFAGLAAVAYDAYTDISQFNKAIFAGVGNFSNTARELRSVADQIANVSGNYSQAADAVMGLVQAGIASQHVLLEMGSAISAISNYTGKSVEDITQDFDLMGGSVEKATEAIAKKYGLISAETYRAIIAAEAAGDSQRALDILSEELNDKALERQEKHRDSLSEIEKDWIDLKGAVSGYYAEVKRGLSDIPEDDWEKIKAAVLIGYSVPFSGVVGSFAGFSVGKKLTSSDDSEEDSNVSSGTIDRTTDAIKDRTDAQSDAISAEEELRRATQQRLKNEQLLRKSELESKTAIEKKYDEIFELEKTRASISKIGTNEDGSTDQSVVDQLDGIISKKWKELESLEKAEKDRNERLNKPATVRESAAEKMIQKLKEQEAVLRSQIVSEEKLTKEQKDQQALIEQFAAIELKSKTEALTLDEKSLLANKEAILLQQQKNVEASIELKNKQKLAELDALRVTLNGRLQADSRKYEDQVVGAGQSDKEVQRMKERLALQRQFNQDADGADKMLAEGKISQDDYSLRMDEYRENLAERERLLEESYDRMDKIQGDWSVGASKAWNNYLESGKNVAGLFEGFFTSSFDKMEDAIVGFVTTGKIDFKSLAVSILTELTRIATKIAMTKALESMFGSGSSVGGGGGNWITAIGSMFGATQAKGGAWDGGTQMFAKGGVFTNSVVSKPTSFGMSNGKRGLMGEAGPEAIMPLTRTSDGSLGVQMVGGGAATSTVVAPVTVTVNSDSGGGASSGSSEQQGRGVQQAIKSEVEKVIHQGLQPGGSIWRAMNNR